MQRSNSRTKSRLEKSSSLTSTSEVSAHSSPRALPPSSQLKHVSLGKPLSPLPQSRRPQSAMSAYPSLRPMSRIGKSISGSSNLHIFNDAVESPKNANVKVVVRVRPFLPRETQKGYINLVSMQNETTTINPPPPSQSPSSTRASARRTVDPKSFTFDHSFWSCNKKDPHYSGQEDVYRSVGKEFLDHNLEGYHTCIFAYGQTGSGKSHTMMGDESDPGLIPRTCQDLFERIEKMTSGHVTCTVRVSYFEVYNEQVRDLLVTSKEGGTPNGQLHHKLRVRESPTDGPYVEDLSEFSVKTADEVLKYLSTGNKARATAATKMNDVSSRSHAVFTLVVKQVITDPVTDATEEKTARIRLVDLAGSERANSTGATGQRLREGSNINKSLTTLGRVIAALADNAGDTQGLGSGRSSPVKRKSGNSSCQSLNGAVEGIIPYRDSVLTWLLKDSLGGNSKTAMVACISPTDYDETLSTLRYADQAKNIRTRAVVNQDIVSAADRDKLLAEMQEQINNLQTSLHQHQQQEKSTLELEKVKSVIRFYEDRAIEEESKRRAIQVENNAVKRHNKLLTDHLKEVTNKTLGNVQVVVEQRKLGEAGETKENQSPIATKECTNDSQPPSYMLVPTVSYEVLNGELQELLGDINSFKANLLSDINAFSSRTNSVSF